VGHVMREGAQRERQLVRVVRVANHRFDEIARPCVVQQVAEELVSEWVVAKVLNHGSAVRVRVRFDETVGGQTWVTPQEQRTNRAVPRRVDNRLVRENCKGVSRLNRQEERKDCEQETSHAEPEAQSVPERSLNGPAKTVV